MYVRHHIPCGGRHCLGAKGTPRCARCADKVAIVRALSSGECVRQRDKTIDEALDSGCIYIFVGSQVAETRDSRCLVAVFECIAYIDECEICIVMQKFWLEYL